MFFMQSNHLVEWIHFCPLLGVVWPQEVPGLVPDELDLVDLLQGVLLENRHQVPDEFHPGQGAKAPVWGQLQDHLRGQGELILSAALAEWALGATAPVRGYNMGLLLVISQGLFLGTFLVGFLATIPHLDNVTDSHRYIHNSSQIFLVSELASF